MTPSEALRAAKALIDAPEKWTKGAFAVLKTEFHVMDSESLYEDGIPDDDIQCYCAEGALARVYGQGWSTSFAYTCLWKSFTIARTVAAYNDDDNTMHSDIMELYDEAIRLAESGTL